MEEKAFNVKEIEKAAKDLGIGEGDIILVHSSFKSVGTLENGADTLISGLLAALGEEGTLVFPTLCQKDWEHIYETWHLDKDSDVGYLTNYFRKLPGAKRSDQATHSVAAIGKHAEYLTETHGLTGKRACHMGETPFASDSPWQKMYDMGSKILLIGVKPRCVTFRHLSEAIHTENILKQIEKTDRYAEMYSRFRAYGKPHKDTDPWLHLNYFVVEDRMTPFFKKGKIGNADCMIIDTKFFTDAIIKALESRDLSWFDDEQDGKNFFAWADECERIAKEGK